MPISFPYMRRKSYGSVGIRIEVMADSMRVGKTTAVDVITDGLRTWGKPATAKYEDWEHNPYLVASYTDQGKQFLLSQKWFIMRKWEQISEVGVGVTVQDVPPEMDYSYPATNLRLGRMTEERFEEYARFFYSLVWSQVPAPDLIVYLAISDQELIERATASRREFENVDEEYFLAMKRVNREWLEGITPDYNVLVVDTDQLDFANEAAAKAILMQKVIERIS